MPMVRMGVVQDFAIVKGSIEHVFNVVANFANVEKWDPGVKSSAPRNPGQPLAVGAKFDIITVFKGSEAPMVFEVKKIEPPNFIELEGVNDKVTSIDSIRFSRDPSNPDGMTRIDYTADMSLHSWRKPFIAFLGGALDELGRDAMTGLQNYFATGNKGKQNVAT